MERVNTDFQKEEFKGRLSILYISGRRYVYCSGMILAIAQSRVSFILAIQPLFQKIKRIRVCAYFLPESQEVNHSTIWSILDTQNVHTKSDDLYESSNYFDY